MGCAYDKNELVPTVISIQLSFICGNRFLSTVRDKSLRTKGIDAVVRIDMKINNPLDSLIHKLSPF